MSLYDDLGVPRDASEEEIKKAYRKKAAQSHPDKGGSTEGFQKVQRAYAILRLPHKRREYDTGGNPDTNQDSEEILALQTLSSMVQAIIDQHPQPWTLNIPVQVAATILHTQQEFSQKITGLQARVTKFNRMLGRFKRKSTKHNFLERMIQQNIEAQVREIAEVQKMRERGTLMMEMLHDFEFTMEQAQQTAARYYITHTSSTHTA